MIRSFRHKGLEQFFRTGSKAGIQPTRASKLRLILTGLNVAQGVDEMNIPGWRLHPLSGELTGYWSVTVNGNWRVVFRFQGTDTELADYLDYH